MLLSYCSTSAGNLNVSRSTQCLICYMRENICGWVVISWTHLPKAQGCRSNRMALKIGFFFEAKLIQISQSVGYLKEKVLAYWARSIHYPFRQSWLMSELFVCGATGEETQLPVDHWSRLLPTRFESVLLSRVYSVPTNCTAITSGRMLGSGWMLRVCSHIPAHVS